MANANLVGKIEVIDPQGNVAFYTLNPQMGVTTIGSSASSDIVIHSPDIDQVHAVLFYDERACQIALYSDKAKTYRDDEDDPLPPGKYWLNDGDMLRVNEHVLVYLDRAQQAGALAQDAAMNGNGHGRSNGAAGMPASRMVVDGLARSVQTPIQSPAQPPALIHPNAELPKGLPEQQNTHSAHIELTKKEFVAKVEERVRITVRVNNNTKRTTAPNANFRVWLVHKYGRRLDSPPHSQTITNVRAGSNGIAELVLMARMDGCYEAYVCVSSAELSYSDCEEITLFAYPKDVLDGAQPKNMVLEMTEREATADTGQPAHYAFTLSNTGDREANFLITIEPAFPKHWNEYWAVTRPPSLYLHNGGSAALGFSVDVTGVPDTQAGVYPIRVTVRSGAYPHSQCSAVALLRIEPRADFAISGLSRSVLNHSAWLPSHRERSTRFEVRNLSNCRAPFLIGVTDKAGECDFRIDTGERIQPSPALVEIGAGDPCEVTVYIAPRPTTHKFIAFSPQVLDFTVTTTMQNDPPQAPRQVMGQAKSMAWLHPLAALLTLALICVAGVLVFWPRALVFKGNDQEGEFPVQGGQPIRLNWNTWAASNVRIEPEIGNVDSSGQINFLPKAATKIPITVTASNFLATTFLTQVVQILEGWPFNYTNFRSTRVVTADVMSITINIENFSIPTIPVFKGDSVQVNWSGVTNAQMLNISRSDGGPARLIPNSDYPQGTMQLDGFNEIRTVIVTLTASNPYAVTVTKSVNVVVRAPDAQVLRFDVIPSEVTGKQGVVRAQWETTGVTTKLERVGLYATDKTLISDTNSFGRDAQVDLTPGTIADIGGLRQPVIYTLTAYNEQNEPGIPVSRTVYWNPDPSSTVDASICATFRFTPTNNTEVTLGKNTDNVRLHYEVKLDPNYRTTVEIGQLSYFSRPVFISSTMPAVEDVFVPISEPGTFPYTLKVTRDGLEDKPTVCSTQLKVLPAAEPLPQIYQVTLLKDGVSQTPSANGAFTWAVNAGSTYQLLWTSSANTANVFVTYGSAPAPYGPGGPFDFTARTSIKSIVLTPYRGDNVPGPSVEVVLRVTPLSEPAQVINLSGVISDSTTILNWTYGDNRGTGFLIRRQDKQTGVVDGTFDVPKGGTTYPDSEHPHPCGKVYNIFVKYIGEDGVTEVVSLASGTQPYISPDCFAPTPTPPPDPALETTPVTDGNAPSTSNALAGPTPIP